GALPISSRNRRRDFWRVCSAAANPFRLPPQMGGFASADRTARLIAIRRMRALRAFASSFTTGNPPVPPRMPICCPTTTCWWREAAISTGTTGARQSVHLNRNNGVAAGAFQSLQDNTVGIGLRLACSPDYRALGRDMAWAEDWSRTTESLWRTWADTVVCDAAGQQTFNSLTQLVFRSALENGEALCLPLWLPRNDTPFNTCLQLVDSDRLSNPQFMPANLYLRGGIETDVYGKPI